MVADIKADETKWTPASTSLSFLYSSSFLFPSLSWCLNTSCYFEQILLHLFWVLRPNKTTKIDHLIMIHLCTSSSLCLLSAIFRVSILLLHPFVLVIHMYYSIDLHFMAISDRIHERLLLSLYCSWYCQWLAFFPIMCSSLICYDFFIY